MKKKIIGIIPLILLCLAIVAVIGYALNNYSDTGSYILLKTHDSFAPVTEKLEMLRIPYGAESISPEEAATYDENADGSAEYMLLETRAELISMLAEACAVDGVEVIRSYQGAHTFLFAVLIISAAVVVLICIIAGICARNNAIRAIYITAAFLAVAVCMLVLIYLELSPVL